MADGKRGTVRGKEMAPQQPRLLPWLWVLPWLLLLLLILLIDTSSRRRVAVWQVEVDTSVSHAEKLQHKTEQRYRDGVKHDGVSTFSAGQTSSTVPSLREPSNKIPAGLEKRSKILARMSNPISNPMSNSTSSLLRVRHTNVKPGAPVARRRLQPKLFLDRRIRREQLASLDLSLYQSTGSVDPNGEPIPNLGCMGNACPDFGDCTGNAIQACHIPAFHDDGTLPAYPWLQGNHSQCPDPGDWSSDNLFLPQCQVARRGRSSAEWQAQVVLLRDVFVDSSGQVFNATHVFLAGGCTQDSGVHTQFSYGPKTEVTEFATLVNFAIGSRGRHGVFEVFDRLPLFMVMAPLLPKLVGRARFYLGESKFLASTIDHILGVSPRELATQIPSSNQLIFARTLYQPVHQACKIPSPSLWRHLRQASLLAPSPRPIFNSDWTLRRGIPVKPLGVQEAATKLPVDWGVILAQPPHAVPLELETESGGYYHQEESPEHVLASQFWFGNMATFEDGLDLRTSRSLFSNAALFVTTPGAAVAQMTLMPPGTMVLFIARARETREDMPVGSHGGITSELYALATAIGLRIATLFCTSTDTETRSIRCSRDSMAGAIAWAADQLITMLPETSALRQVAGLIPGTGLKSRGEVRRFKEWLECVTQKGSWEVDPRPRALPWPYHGSLERCDLNHVQEGDPNVAGSKADAMASDPNVDPASWQVREGTKYVWRVSSQACPAPADGHSASNWVNLDREEICRPRARGKLRILVLGDSIQEQFAKALVQNVLVGLDEQSKRKLFAFERIRGCQDWLGEARQVTHHYCLESVFADGLCDGLRVEFMRNDLLEIYHHEEPVFDRMPWAQELKPHLDRADIIIINRGPHYTPMPQFERALKATARLLRRWYPGKLLVYRNTPPGHANCTEYKRPLTRRQDPETLPYNWDKFRAQNERAKEIVDALGFVYLDVDTMTGLRADGHKGYSPEAHHLDCLHYCSPGPMDTWVQLLFNTLKHLKFGQL